MIVNASAEITCYSTKTDTKVIQVLNLLVDIDKPEEAERFTRAIEDAVLALEGKFGKGFFDSTEVILDGDPSCL